MTTLSRVDQTAEIACTLPAGEAGDRLDALRALIGDRLQSSARDGNRLRIRIARSGDPALEATVTEWAQAEKACCGFFGFAIESEPDAVTLEIEAPSRAGPILGGIDWLIRQTRPGAA